MIKPDFTGYVTRNDILCMDGVTIRQDAFKDNDGAKVPLVWQHDYKDVRNVLGHIVLHSVDDGVIGEGYLNETESGEHAKAMLKHGDIDGLSIGARGIRKDSANNVLHGDIYEVSLVMKGANPGALIEHKMQHSAYGDYMSDDEAIIHNGLKNSVEIAEEGDNEDMNGSRKEEFSKEEEEAIVVLLTEGPDVLTDEQVELINNFSEEQNAIVDAIAEVVDEEDIESYFEDEDEIEEDDFDDEETDDEEYFDDEEIETEVNDDLAQGIDYEGDYTLKHNAFNTYNEQQSQVDVTYANTLLQSAITGQAGSLASVMVANGVEGIELQHGLTNIDVLFPAPANQSNLQFYNPGALNIEKVMGMFSTSPMSRIKNVLVDLSEEEARARGFIKGNEKLDSIEDVWFRETTPTTIYRKTRFDRDDMVDMQEGGIEVVSYVQKVQQQKLKEEIVRCAFIGDGRRTTTAEGTRNPEKVSEMNIRPIVKDVDLYSVKVEAADFASLVDTGIVAMGAYQGSGSPKLFINPFDLAEMKILKDKNGRYLYGNNVDANNVANNNTIATYFGCDEVIELRFLPRGTMVIGNLSDYKFGLSRGGQVATFDQFDIDFNQQKYLIETRLSGAIQVPKSFIVITVKSLGSTKHPELKFTSEGLKSKPSFTTNTDGLQTPGKRYASKDSYDESTASASLKDLKSAEDKSN